jgi:hypothetical protein
MATVGKKHVVYILGAGFSQPLGIPTIASFLDRAKTLRGGDSQAFAYFDNIFETIKVLERAHNFFRTDRTSIEDLLTMLDLKDELEGTTDSQLFKQFICDVVLSSTPNIRASAGPQRWSDLFFGGEPWASYGVFVSALLGYEFSLTGTPRPNAPPALGDYECQEATPDVRYSVISLNYDMVLEKMAEHINAAFHRSGRTFVSKAMGSGTPLVKLHGSVVNKDSIVPPLLNKQYVDIAGLWGEAFAILKSANQIRVVGYSLPEADSYVRFLLRSAAVETPHLQRIDVLCMDNKGRVQRRYRNFITFTDYRRGKDRLESFRDADCYGYLANYQSHTEQWAKVIRPSDLLERIHANHFGL